ncbi:MAG: tyrosine-type recombinase/integrase family protein, partial [Clostridia bacterium]|nr:tyrosine-type recombinase/integrase family protein [Clostridia bacterium]
MQYKDWLNEWLDYYVQPRTKKRTYEKYSKQINKHVLPVLGEYNMDDLTAVTLQKFVAALIDKGLSANTVNGVITLLKTSLQRAVSVGVAQRQYSDFIVRPKTREKQVECFSKDEQKKIERYVFDKNKPKLFGIVFCLYTGLRIGELLALTWEDVDLQKGIIAVSKSCHDSWEDGEYVKVIDEPKTESSMRII